MTSMIGVQIGNFTLTREIGRGGMGTVFLAEHAFIARRKAVKVLGVEAARSASLVRRFFDEATAASACQHDHIVNIEDCGTFTVDGRAHHYIEMEFLDGVNLNAACRQSSLGRIEDVDRAVKIVSYAADALAAAHALGIVHRDVKPENLFLARRGNRSDYLKVLDFGIARLTGELAPGVRTRTGAVMGTPEFMSPEQAMGLHPDGKSDVFSLAVVLYRVLGGVVPFSGDSFAQVALQINDANPVPLGAIRRDVPPGVIRAVEAGMRKRPDARPTMLEWQALLLANDAAPRALAPELSIKTATPRLPGTPITAPPTITAPDDDSASRGSSRPAPKKPRH